MNYLAHAYLSFERPAIVVGNLISDFVKGKKKFEYPVSIQQGMDLHRAIDQFTDAHGVTKEAASLFKPEYGLYSMAFIDIVYDHFLASDEHLFTDKSLLEFSKSTYAVLNDFSEYHPPKFARMFPSMVSNNWLFNYRHPWGIHRSFEGLVYRARYMDDALPAFTVFENNYEQFRKYFGEFFPELEEFVRAQLNKIDESDQ